MQRATVYINILFLLGIVLPAASAVIAQPQSPYEQGLESLYQGDIEEALDIWEEYYSETRWIDSRAGFEFIKVVTAENMTERFPQATRMYYQAISNASGIFSRIAIRQEIERLKPIIGDGIYRQWIEWWDDENRRLNNDMRGYWVQLDPTPTTPVNERLIEHWQRIAEAQARFTRNRSSAYGTDDRALIYIRYGEPDRIRRGILTLQDLNIKPWLERQVIARQRSDSERDLPEEPIEAQQVRAMENAVYDFHRYPEYEVWFYDEITEGVSEDPLLFIFGTNADTDRFELHKSVDDFIPERAYNPEEMRRREAGDFTRVGITPALVLQMLYYEQLSSLDPFFSGRLNSLRDAVIEQSIEAFRGLDLSFRAESIELINRRTVQAPRQISSFRKKLPEIPIHIYNYRFLDEEGTPYLLTFLESQPQEAFLIDFNRNRPDDISLSDIEASGNIPNILPQYSLVHDLQIYDDEWEVEESRSENPPLFLTRTVERDVSKSVFEFPHTKRKELAASVTLKNSDEASRSLHETPYPRDVRGLGSIYFRHPQPLTSHEDSLQFADLVLGYQMLDEPEGPFSFIVANDQAIPLEETLVLHFEVYNLELQANGFANFELTYRIFPVDEDGVVQTDQTEFVLTLNFTSEERRLIEDLEIMTADLRPGLYELRVRVTDTNTDQEKDRSIRFEVVE